MSCSIGYLIEHCYGTLLGEELDVDFCLMCSGQGWNQLDPVVASELLSQIQKGKFCIDEEKVCREFDEITMGFPVKEEGQLQSLYTGVV